MTTRRHASALLAAAVVAVGATACSDDDAPEAAPPSTSASPSVSPSSASPTPSPSPSASSASPTPSATSSSTPSPSATAPSATPTSAPSPSPSPSGNLPTAAEVVRSARTYALSGSSATVRGSLRGDDGRTFGIDLTGNAAGTNQRLRLAIPQVGRADVLTVGGKYWLGGDLGFWTEQLGDATAARGVVGKWVVIGESDATELGAFDLRGILTDVFARPEVAALERTGTPVATDRVGDREAWVVGPSAGPRIWVAADGGGELLRYRGPQAAPADLLFTGWERAQTFGPPPPSSVVEQ